MSRKRKNTRIYVGYRGTTNVGHKMCDHIGKNLEPIQGKHSTDSLQNAALLGTAHVMRKVRQSDT